MKRLFAILLLILPMPLLAQRTASNPLGGNLSVQDAGTCSTTGSFLWQQLPSNAATTIVNLAGTFSGTLTIRLSNNGGGSWTTNSTTTTAGNTSISTNGFTDICADVTTFTSGSFGVTITTGLNTGPQGPAGPAGSGGGTPTPGLTFTVSPTCNGAANCFAIKGDTQYIWDGTTVNGQNTISCPNNDCNFTAADDGTNCFATNAPLVGFTGQIVSTVILPEGTFTHTGAQTGTCNGGNANTSLTGTAVFFWGHPDTTTGAGGGTDLIAAAWNATIAACGTLHFGGINKQGTGPLMVWIEQPEFNTGTSTTLPTGNATCAAGSEGNRRGLTVSGTDVNSTFFLIAPNMAYANCLANGCWLTMADGENLHDFTMWGAGVSTTSLANSSTLITINGQAGGTSGNNAINNVRFMGLGAGSGGNNLTGLAIGGGNTHISHVEVDGWGSIGCSFVTVAVMHADSLYCGDNGVVSLSISSNTAYELVTTDSTFGPTTGATHNTVHFLGSGTWTSVGDQISDFGNGGNTTGGAIYCNGAGRINLVGDIVKTASSQDIFLDTNCNAYLRDTQMNATGAGAFAINNSAGKVVDEGGNSYSGTSGPYTAASTGTLIADGHSLKGFCAGTVTSSSTLGMYGTGYNLTSATCTTTIGAGIPVNGARTLQTLTCTSSATTVSVACTVFLSHNGAAFASTGITCTMTAATFCIDATHTAAAADGDLVEIQIATGAAETGANIKSLVEWN